MPIVLLATFFVNIIILMFVYGRMKSDKTVLSKSLFGMLACTAGWNLSDLLSILIVNNQLSIIIHEMKFIFVLSLPGMLHYFAHYLRFGRLEGKWQFYVRSAITFPILILVATNSMHHLFRVEILINNDFLKAFTTINGPVYYFMLIYVYGVVLHSAYYIFSYHFSKPKLYRGKTALMMIGLVISILVNFAFQIFRQYGFYVDFTPISFGLIAWLFYYAIFIYESREIPNVAKTYILDTLGTGILFLDDESKILYMNDKFEDISLVRLEDVRSQPIEQLPRKIADVINEAMTYKKPVQYKLATEKIYVYEVEVNQLVDIKARIIGTVISFNDVTSVELQFVKQKYQYINNDLSK